MLWLVVGIGVTCGVADVVLVVTSWGDPVAEAYYLRAHAAGNVVVWASCLAIGSAIVLRRAGHRVGWLLAVIGTLMLASGAVTEYMLRGLVLAPGSLPVVGAFAVVAQSVWVVPIALLAVLLLIYPTGSLVSRRWWAGVAMAAAAVPGVAGGTFAATWAHRDRLGPLMLVDDFPPTSRLVTWAFGVGLGLLLAAFATAVVSLLVRWRRAAHVERLQLKWLLLAVALWTTVAVVDTVLAPTVTSAWSETVNVVGLAAIPWAIAVAILRHRLYEIDRLISRTVTYTVVVGVVVVVYAAVAVLPSVLLDVHSDLLVAVATLGAAAVFAPVRNRVRSLVDRRFNRGLYDAQRIVAGFTAGLRDDVREDRLVADLRHAVVGSLQPTHVDLWLAGRGARAPVTVAITDSERPGS